MLFRCDIKTRYNRIVDYVPDLTGVSGIIASRPNIHFILVDTLIVNYGRLRSKS